ncbi:DUF1196 domain-containing protein, partial [Vibrio cholerae]|nr:DUF1196 domain-containing protein [Vibrio cholerae]
DWKRHALTVPLEAFVMCVLDYSLHTGLRQNRRCAIHIG